MTDSKDRKTDFTGCCPGWDFQFPMDTTQGMSEMMKNRCTEDSSFDCASMMKMFKDKDGSYNVNKMMEMMKQMMSKE
jgi:hypothetical protein